MKTPISSSPCLLFQGKPQDFKTRVAKIISWNSSPFFFSSSKPEQKFQTPSKEMNIMETYSNRKKASKMMKNL
jgi:hypothetical protein